MPQVSFRADDELAARLDGLAAAMKERLQGLEISRSDLLKMLIKQALPPFELEYRGQVPGMSLPEASTFILDYALRVADMALRDGDKARTRKFRAALKSWSRDPDK